MAFFLEKFDSDLSDVIITGMTKVEMEGGSGEIVLSQIQKEALFSALPQIMIDRTRLELRGMLKKQMVEENDGLRALIKKLVTDLHIDVEHYAPAESLLLMGFSDCFPDEKLLELRDIKPDTDIPHDVEWAEKVSRAARYFLARRIEKRPVGGHLHQRPQK